MQHDDTVAVHLFIFLLGEVGPQHKLKLRVCCVCCVLCVVLLCVVLCAVYCVWCCVLCTVCCVPCVVCCVLCIVLCGLCVCVCTIAGAKSLSAERASQSRPTSVCPN